MKRSTRQLILFFVLLAVVLPAKTRLDSLEQRLLQSIKDRAQQQNIDLNWSTAGISLPASLSMQGLHLTLPTPQGRLPLQIDTLDLQPRLLQLLMLKLAAHGDADFYAGHVQADFEQSLLGSSRAGNFSISNLHLQNHPLAKLWGLNGIVNADGKFEGAAGRADLRLENGVLSLENLGGGLIKISPVSAIEASGAVLLQGSKLLLNDLQLTSSHGQAHGDGELSLVGKNIRGGTINLSIELSDLGTTELSPYLALAANLPIDSLIRNWTIQLSISPAGAAIKQLRPTV